RGPDPQRRALDLVAGAGRVPGAVQLRRDPGVGILVAIAVTSARVTVAVTSARVTIAVAGARVTISIAGARVTISVAGARVTISVAAGLSAGVRCRSAVAAATAVTKSPR